MKLAVIIVNFHGGEKALALAEKISRFKSASIVCFVSNEATADEKSAIKKSLEKNTKVELVFNSENLGFAKGVNLGIRAALKKNAEAVLLLNPDVAIENSQIEKLLQSFGDIVSPVLKFRRLEKDVYDHGGKVNRVLGRTYHQETTDYGLQSTASEIDYISGACMLISSKVFGKIGQFDERFFMYFEDVDFCLRAKSSILSVQVQEDLVVEHQILEHRYSSPTTKLNYLIKSNRLFIDKWIPWYYKPTAYAYWLALAVKSWWSGKILS